MRNAHNFLRYKHFNKDERNELAILLKKDYSLRNIAEILGRSPASASREVKRNSVNGRYEPDKANHKARVKRLRSKYQGMKIRESWFLENYIHEKIKSGWSPERIAGRLKLETGISVAHKTIYKYIHRNPFGSRLKFAIEGMKEILSPLPVKSLTLDNGRENARYHKLGIKSYFCHPYTSWQKGSVENAIGLIREHIPKKSDLSDYSNDCISAIIDRINSIPMKCLNFHTPKEIFCGRYLFDYDRLLRVIS